VRILVAEDDRDIADLIAHYLRKQGWVPHVVSGGEEAVAYARRHAIDLVVLDLMLPGVSGLEVCRLLRADKTTETLPIIMVTARAEDTDRIIGLDIGADDYLAKPFNPNELVARVRALIRRSKRRQRP
jgi:two-component system, OmpR family, alkaline phosphatase synthesis response regulator PhoP